MDGSKGSRTSTAPILPPTPRRHFPRPYQKAAQSFDEEERRRSYLVTALLELGVCADTGAPTDATWRRFWQ